MKAIIYKPTKSANQSGTKNSQKWVLEYKGESKFIEPINGWTGSSNTDSQVRIEFDTLDDAERFAQSNSIRYEIVDYKQQIFSPNVYSNNFK